MASRIKGITVEIGGDTTKLQDALKDVNKEIRNTQSQLKDVEKLLKLDPGNTTLLAQRHRLLGEAVEETSQKLETLKLAANQANDALLNGDISVAQYDALQREVLETEHALESLERQANESATAVQKIAFSGENLQELGGKIEGVGTSLLPISAAITGVGVAGLKVATDFEKAMSGVKAITGATGEDFEKLRQVAIDLGASTSFSSGEVAEAMTEMAKAGWSTTQIIDGMAGVLNATASSSENLSLVSTILADAITGFGLSAKDSARVADLMTQAANSGTIGISDLGESYKYIAPLAQSMGLSIEDVTTALSAMSMAGIKGSQAGTSLRTVLANMAKPSSTVADAMNELGISITNSDGSFQSLNAIVTIMREKFAGLTDDQKAYYATALAGKEGMSGLISLLNLTQEEYNALSDSMNHCSGIAEQTASVMQDNLQSKVEQLGGALESLAIQLAEYVIPFLTGLIEKVTVAVEAFTNLSPWLQQAILLIGGIIAVAGPLLVLIGNVITSIGTIMTIMPKLSALMNGAKLAFGAFNATLLANPIAIVIVAITALVTAFLYLWNTSEEFRTFWINLWEKLESTVTNICDLIQNGIENTASNIVTTVKTKFEEAVQFIKNLKNSAFEWGADMINGIVNGIKSCIGNVKGAVTEVADTIRSFLHFSVPDEGPLTDYESWMPDFMEGLARGIEQSRNMVRKAIENVSTDMMIQPKVSEVENTQNSGNFMKSTDLRELVDMIREVVTDNKNEESNIVIPVYVGGTLLDEVVVSAQTRQNLRSGGR